VPPYFCRRYVGAEPQYPKPGTVVVDIVDPGREVLIWMDEVSPQPIESPDVQATLDARGARWMQCYSVLAPDGEGGWISTPDPTIIRVSAEEFETARAASWEHTPAAWAASRARL
jgi:hypothetical protein